MKSMYDVGILGLGAMGSAALYQLSKKGLSVVGIDAYAPPHDLSSSGGETRIMRQAIGEGKFYTPLALQSYALWEELEKITNEQLVHKIGGLVLAKPESVFFSTTLYAAKKYQIKHAILDAKQIQKQFPTFKVKDTTLGYYEFDAGYVRPEKIISTQLEQAHKGGAHLKFNERVLTITPEGDALLLTTDKERYAVKKVVIALGSYLFPFLIAKYQRLFDIFRQVLFWFELVDNRFFDPKNAPVFIWELPDARSGIYGFPAVDGPLRGIKIATHNMDIKTTPLMLNRLVSQDERKEFYRRFVKDTLAGLGDRCLKAQVCTYTTTPDENFIIDYIDDSENIMLVSACSGHGFKHSAAVGKTVADCIKSEDDPAHYPYFSLNRFEEPSGHRLKLQNTLT